MADKAFINPDVLKWARESARMSQEIAASKVNVSASRLSEWEEGSDQPTIRQAENLAKAYRRPFALFFLPEIPRDFMPLQDFRRQNAKELGTASIFIIREIQQKQAWMSEINEENQESGLGFVGRFTVNSDPKVVAEDILKTLGISPANYGYQKPMKVWIDKAETQGIFISRTSFLHSKMLLDSEEMQGFAIADKYAPFVFVNSEDWDAPQLFTLVHELAHIWIAASGISNDIDPALASTGKLDPIELFCNEVAANALMPAEMMWTLSHSDFSSSEKVLKASRKFGASSFAFLVRALNMNLINNNTYKYLKGQLDVDFQAYIALEAAKKEKKKDINGGPNPYLLRTQKNSRLFTQIVLDAFRGGRIPPTQASSLLNTQVNNFPKLEAFLY